MLVSSNIKQIINELDHDNDTDGLLLDFSKAFDKIPMKGCTINYYNVHDVSPQLLNWIADFLKCTFQRVVAKGHSSDLSQVLSGVPQGTVLAPLHFICYVNDISLLFISKMLIIISTQKDVKILQEHIIICY